MQVAHPVIGAGVRDFSAFRADPWGRLDRTVTSLTTQLFGGSRRSPRRSGCARCTARSRALAFMASATAHSTQQAYAYVHLSNIDSTLKFNDLFVRLLSTADKRRLYADWRQAGLVLGIKDSHLPTDVEGLRAYIDDKVANELELNATCSELIATLNLRDVPPPYAMFPEPRVGRTQAGRSAPAARHHDRHPATRAAREARPRWTASDEARLQRVATAVRAASRLVPDSGLHYPLAYQAVRAARPHERGCTT